MSTNANIIRTKDYITVEGEEHRASFRRDDAARKMQTPMILTIPPTDIFHYASGKVSIHMTYGQWLNLKHVVEALEYEIEGEICWREEEEYEAYCASLEAKEARPVEEF